MDLMEMELEKVERVETGTIVIISGEYMATKTMENKDDTDLVFMVTGEKAPIAGDEDTFWKLVEPIDFAS
jgi:hypothetical protein